jgi:hypothetical protein
MKCQIRNVRRLPFVAALLCYFLLHAQTVWGDYLLTFKSGLQIRVQTYRVDASSIQVWTEFGSMTFPADTVMVITESRFPPVLYPRPSTAPSPSHVENEQTQEQHLDPRRHRPLYIPDEKSPHE